MSDEVRAPEPCGFVRQIPGPGGRADATGKWPAAGDFQMPRFPDLLFNPLRLRHASPVLMGDHRRERLASAIHGHPGWTHDSHGQAVRFFCVFAKRRDRACHRFQQAFRRHLDAFRGAPGFKKCAGGFLEHLCPTQDTCNHGRGTHIKTEDGRHPAKINFPRLLVQRSGRFRANVFCIEFRGGAG